MNTAPQNGVPVAANTPVSSLVVMSDAQLAQILKATQPDSFRRMPAGVGQLPQELGSFQSRAVGVGAPFDCQTDPSMNGDVYMFLRLGSPRLALARAWGVPMAPYFVNCRATFPTVGTSYIPDVGSDVKIVQDTYVDGMVGRLTNLSTTANQSQLQTLSDYFFNFQNGLNVLLDVQGAPRFSIAPKFTPISTLADMINGSARWPNGWVLTYQQQLQMAFQATIPLPTAPYELCCTFRSWTPTNDMFVDMRNRDAVAYLRAEGFQIPDAYTDRVCR